MTDTFRALCTELVEAWDATADFDFNDFGHAAADIVTCARAALAHPEPVAPTDEELLVAILLSYLITNTFIIAGVIRHWDHT